MAIGKLPQLLVVMVAVVLLSSECSSVLAISFGPLETKLSIINQIKPNATLYVHCRNNRHDFGPKVLGFGDHVVWKFKMNFWGTTRYWCSMSWDSDGHRLFGSGDVFNKKQQKRCWGDAACDRRAKEDGFWATGGDKGDYMLFPWSKD